MSGALLGHAIAMASATVSLAALIDIQDTQVGSASTATLTIEADGDIISNTTGSGPVDLGDWVSPKSSAGAGYDVRVDVNSGSLTSGTTGSWQSLGSNRSWSVVDAVGDASPIAANITVQIRDASTLAVLASKTIDITADYGT